MKKLRNKIASLLLIALLVLGGVLPFLKIQIAYAAALTGKKDAMSRLKLSAADPNWVLSDHAIEFTTPTGVASTQTIVITFPADFDGVTDAQGALDFSDVDLFEDTTPDTTCDGTAETLVASAPAAGEWSAVFSGTEGRTLTFTSGGATAIIAAASQVCVKIGENATGGSANSQYANPTTSGSKTITLAVGPSDTGNIIVNILADDQVAVSGTVAESMTFTLGAVSVALGTLSSSAVTSGSHTVTLATNAASGLTLSYSGTTLTFGANTITAMSTAAASSIGTEQFGINAKLNTTPAVGAECSGTSPIAAAATGYATVNNFKFVTGETVISSAGGINSTSCTISYIANILGSTEAGGYTTTLTYNATANF